MQDNTLQPEAGARRTLAVDPTGVPNLDVVLNGGLPRGSLVLVVGPPGSGKTTLAAQLAVAAARRGRRVIILTVLAEPPSKLLAHLRTYSFWDDDLVGGAIQVLSLEQFLPEGLASSAEKVVALARDQRADLVVLDGFRVLPASVADLGAAAAFLHTVGSALSVPGTTTIVTAQAEPRDAALFPEATTADVLLALHYTLNGVREERSLEAIKIRGAARLPGLHAWTLTAAGATVYPRLEARVRTEAGPEEDAPDLEERALFGLPELDALLNGGLTRETSALVLGSLGTGKTLLALHFALAGIDAGEPTVYLGFRETRGQLLRRGDAFALGERLRASLMPGGGLTLQHMDPIELDPDVVADDLLSIVDASRARRLVVDSITELERAVARSTSPQRLDDYLAALLTALRARRVSTLFIKESHTLVTTQLELSADAISILAENVLLLQQVVNRDRLIRVLSVLKMRFSAHDVSLREFRIAAPAGLRVLPLAESGVDALTSIARESGAALAVSGDVDPATTEGAP
jgi:circadian clock protein KaiC